MSGIAFLSGRARSFMRILGALFLLLLALDYGDAGPVTTSAAWYKESASSAKMSRVSLPYLAGTRQKGKSHIFMFTMTPHFADRYRPLYVVADDCLRRLAVNNVNVPLKGIPYNALCDITNGITIPMGTYFMMDYPNDVFALVEDTQGGKFGVSFTRGMIFPFWLMLLVGILAPYAIVCSYCATREQWRRVSYKYGAVALFLVSLTSLSYGLPQLALWTQINNLLLLFAAVMLAILITPLRAWLYTLAAHVRRIGSMKPKHYVPLCMLIFLVLTACLEQILNQGMPHIVDAMAQYMHAKLFVEGKLFDTAHALPRFFDFPFVVNKAGKFYSQYYPGHIAFMSLAMWAGAAWLTNPILGALTVGATYLLAREIAGKAAGFVAAALVIASPFIVFISSEYMNHATTLLFLTLFLFCYVRSHKTGDITYAMLAGCCVGIAFITRAQTTLPLALPIAIHALWVFGRDPKRYLARTLTLGFAFGIWLFIFLLYNTVTTGNPLVSPYQLARGDIEATVLSLKPLAFFEYGIRRLMAQAKDMHLFLFSWPISSLIFVLALFFFQAQKRYSGLLLACVLSAVAWLIFNPYNDGIYGPRYLYETSTSLIVLTAIALVRLPAILRKRLHLKIAPKLVCGVSVLVVGGLILAAFPNQIISLYQRYGNKYGGTSIAYYDHLMGKVKKPALLFMTAYDDFRQFYYTMPPRDTNPIIFAKDLGKENEKLMDYYPGRSAYKVTGYKIEVLREVKR